MNIEKINSIVCRIGFFGGFLLLVVAALEWIANIFGYTLLHRTYTAGRLLEFAAIALIAVIVLLLRQVREELKKKT